MHQRGQHMAASQIQRTQQQPQQLACPCTPTNGDHHARRYPRDGASGQQGPGCQRRRPHVNDTENTMADTGTHCGGTTNRRHLHRLHRQYTLDAHIHERKGQDRAAGGRLGHGTGNRGMPPRRPHPPIGRRNDPRVPKALLFTHDGQKE